jgi:hypothetical protein
MQSQPSWLTAIYPAQVRESLRHVIDLERLQRARIIHTASTQHALRTVLAEEMRDYCKCREAEPSCSTVMIALRCDICSSSSSMSKLPTTLTVILTNERTRTLIRMVEARVETQEHLCLFGKPGLKLPVGFRTWSNEGPGTLAEPIRISTTLVG